MLGAIYGLIGLGIVSIFKCTKVLNIAQGEMVMLGAFFCYFVLVQVHLPVWVAVLAGIGMAALLGLLLQYLFQRRLIGQPILTLLMMTILLVPFLRGWGSLIWGGLPVAYKPLIIPRGQIELGNVALPYTYLWTFVAALAVFLLMFLAFKYTRIGITLRAVAEGHQTARACGISVKKVFTLVWLISGMVAGVGGILLANYCGCHTLSLGGIGIIALPVVILGGLESIGGALVAGLIIGVTQSMVGGYLDPLIGGGFAEAAPFVLMLIILWFKPYGLFGEVRIERL